MVGVDGPGKRECMPPISEWLARRLIVDLWTAQRKTKR